MNDPQNEFAAFVAIDWADCKHMFSLVAAGQNKKESGTFEHKPEVIGPWVAGLRERFGGRPVAVALEQSRGALIHALLGYDFLVLFPIHPTTVARFREAFKFSGAKSDPLDTEQILEILIKHLDLLKPLQPDTEQTRLLGRLVEDRRKAVNLRTMHVQAALAALKEYFPQAIEALSGNLCSRLAGNFLKKWPTLAAFQQAKAQTLKKFLIGHNIRSPKLIKKVLALAEQACPLTSDPAIVESGWRLAQMHVELIQTLNPLIQEYERRIEELFNEHPERKIFAGLPGAGPALAPRLLAFFGTDRGRFQAADNAQCFSGIAPVSKKSGKMRVALFRQACPKFARQTFHEFAGLSVVKCQWARNYYDYYKARGKKHHAILRELAFKWIRVLFACWKSRQA